MQITYKTTVTVKIEVNGLNGELPNLEEVKAAAQAAVTVDIDNENGENVIGIEAPNDTDNNRIVGVEIDWEHLHG